MMRRVLRLGDLSARIDRAGADPEGAAEAGTVVETAGGEAEEAAEEVEVSGEVAEAGNGEARDTIEVITRTAAVRADLETINTHQKMLRCLRRPLLSKSSSSRRSARTKISIKFSIKWKNGLRFSEHSL